MSQYAAASRAYSAYTESAVTTAPKEQLVVMLYDGAIRFLRQGAGAYRTGEVARAHDRINRADAIITELNVSLDMNYGELPQRLRSIYLYCKRQLNDARVHSDPAPLEIVQRLLGDLRDSWAEIATAAPLAKSA